MAEQGAQEIDIIEINMKTKDSKASLQEQIELWKIKEREKTLKDLINEKPEKVDFYFNYKLNTETWNLLVSKQAYMKFEKLLISKQIQEKKNLEKDYQDQLKQLDYDIEHWIQKRQAKENEDQYQLYHNNKMYGHNHQRGNGSHMYQSSGGRMMQGGHN